MTTAATGQSREQKPHPRQAFSFLRYGNSWRLGESVRRAMARQLTGHVSTQIVHDMHTCGLNAGLSHWERFFMMQAFPNPSRTALCGHILPHAPHSMHAFRSIAWEFFRSPEMASTGQIFLQAPQPLHLSVIS